MHSDFWEQILLASISLRWYRKLSLVHGYLQLMDIVLSELGLGRVHVTGGHLVLSCRALILDLA